MHVGGKEKVVKGKSVCVCVCCKRDQGTYTIGREQQAMCGTARKSIGNIIIQTIQIYPSCNPTT